jgi:hypothetical protein
LGGGVSTVCADDYSSTSGGGMNNWSEAELQFRCERLAVRLERLAESFLRIPDLCRRGNDGDEALVLVQDCRSFLELTAMTLYLERVADRDDRGCQKPYRSLGRHLELNR